MEDDLTNFRLKVHGRYLEDPEFNIANWYNKKRAHHINPGTVEKARNPETCMGDALAIVARHLLEDGVDACYPNVSPPTDKPRFHVSKATPLGREYLIKDHDLDKSVIVQKESLINPEFDLVTWYLDRVNMERFYNLRYDEEIAKLQSAIARTQSSSDPLEILPEPLTGSGVPSIDLDSDSGIHSSMPGLRPITASERSNYSDSIVPCDYIDDKMTHELNDEAVKNLEKRLTTMWRSILNASEENADASDEPEQESQSEFEVVDNTASLKGEMFAPSHMRVGQQVASRVPSLWLLATPQAGKVVRTICYHKASYHR